MIYIKYRIQLIVSVAWIFIVMALFKLIPNKQVAALFTGAGFIILPISFLISELKHAKNKLHIFILSLFLACSALPVFLLRVFNWGNEFASLDLFGIPAPLLHKYSNYFFILMLLSMVYRIIDEKKRT